MKPEDAPEVSADAVVVECDLEAPPEKVWRALTTPELVADWLMENDLRPEVGARFTMKPGADAPETEPVECEVLAAEPHKLLQYTWRDARVETDEGVSVLESVVTFELSETPAGGTHLRVTHDEFELCPQQPVAQLATAVPAVESNVVDIRSRRRREALEFFANQPELLRAA